VSALSAIAVVAIAAALTAQSLNTTARQLLHADRLLTTAEIGVALRASQQAIAGKTFRLSTVPNGAGSEFLMGSGGRLRMFRMSGGLEGGIVGGVVAACASPPCPATTPPARTEWHDYVTTVFEFTGRPAHWCNGVAEPGELVIEYKHYQSTDSWTASARAETQPGLGPGYTPVFDLLRGATPLLSGERRMIGNRPARAFFAPWTPPDDRGLVEVTGDPLPNVPKIVSRLPREETQTLWIDTESLLPLRWEATRPDTNDYGFAFTYEPIDLRRPAGVAVPDCVR
jgi:hypothetical protein